MKQMEASANRDTGPATQQVLMLECPNPPLHTLTALIATAHQGALLGSRLITASYPPHTVHTPLPTPAALMATMRQKSSFDSPPARPPMAYPGVLRATSSLRLIALSSGSRPPAGSSMHGKWGR